MHGISHRDNFGDLLNSLGLLGEGAEVGCAYGGNTWKIMEQWKGRKLWMIDPWTAQDPSIYREKQEPAGKYEAWFRECSTYAGSMNGRVGIIRDYSANAVVQFKDNQLDWVYLDGNHDRRHVEEDLEIWTPKVRNGGVVSGHDYYDKIGDGYYNEVQSAVDGWANATERAIERWRCSSWIAIK